MLNAKLTVVGGAAKAAEVNLKLPTTIGRGRDATLTLPHPLVSRKHCEIFERNGKLFVRDLKSLNGTFVDSERIEGIAELGPEQLLTIGTVTFRAQYQPAGEPGAMMEQAESRMAEASHVLEMDEPASSESDSKISMNGKPSSGKASTEKAGLNEKKTTPGRRVSHPSPKPAGPDMPSVKNPSSDVLDEAVKPSHEQVEHSVVAAMRLKKGKGADAHRDIPATLDELRRLLPELDPLTEASGIDGLEPGDGQLPESVDDFSGIDTDATIRVNVDANDSALGSFIRKMPR